MLLNREPCNMDEEDGDACVAEVRLSLGDVSIDEPAGPQQAPDKFSD